MRVERLGAHHDLEQFSCGNKALDTWLRSFALQNQERNLSRTFVLVDDGDEVIGYYSLTMGGVKSEALPGKYRRGLPDYDIGMVLLGRLAVNGGHHGQGIGRDLMIDAIRSAAQAGAHVAARFISVDPIDEAARAFYKKFGFKEVPGDSAGRMFLRLDAAMALLDDDLH
ncbi:MAG: GNAT family N-acetyltransferase [Acidimicrobiales bacterium]